jgi:hypothetical protein
MIIYEVLNDFDKKTDFKNERIILLKAYFELNFMKNKFLCHSSLTRISYLNFGFFSLAMVLID